MSSNLQENVLSEQDSDLDLKPAFRPKIIIVTKTGNTSVFPFKVKNKTAPVFQFKVKKTEDVTPMFNPQDFEPETPLLQRSGPRKKENTSVFPFKVKNKTAPVFQFKVKNTENVVPIYNPQDFEPPTPPRKPRKRGSSSVFPLKVKNKTAPQFKVRSTEDVIPMYNPQDFEPPTSPTSPCRPHTPMYNPQDFEPPPGAKPMVKPNLRTRNKCKHCGKFYSHRSSLARHQKFCKLGPTPREKSGKELKASFNCEKCNCVLKRGYYKTHLKLCKGENPAKFMQCLDPSCSISFYRRTDMIQHMQDAHSANINIQHLTFDTKEEFFEFKNREDKKNFTCHVKHGGPATGKNATYAYYVCNFDVQGRRFKAKNPRIPRGKCPARMLLKEEKNGKCFVKYINHHTHDIEVENLKYHRYSKLLDKYSCCEGKEGPCEHIPQRKKRYLPKKKRKAQAETAEAVSTVLPEVDLHVSDENELELLESELLETEHLDSECYEDGEREMLDKVTNLLNELHSDIQNSAVQKACLPHFLGVLMQLKEVADSAKLCS